MIRLLGAIFVAVGCMSIGEMQASALRQHVSALESLRDSLTQMEQELSMRLTPLPQLMEKLAKRARSPADGLFSLCRVSLEHLDQQSFSDSWSQILKQVPWINPEDREILQPLGQILGRYSGQAQSDIIAAVRCELEEQLKQARIYSRQRGKLCRTLSAAAGAFLVIFLI